MHFIMIITYEYLDHRYTSLIITLHKSSSMQSLIISVPESAFMHLNTWEYTGID